MRNTTASTRIASRPFDPRPLRKRKDHAAALAYVESLMDARVNTPEADELDLWTTLIELYEDQHDALAPPDPIEAIRFRMEQEGLEPKDLVPFIGSRSRVSEVLCRRRPLSLAMIRALHANLGIPAEVLIRPSAA